MVQLQQSLNLDSTTINVLVGMAAIADTICHKNETDTNAYLMI